MWTSTDFFNRTVLPFFFCCFMYGFFLYLVESLLTSLWFVWNDPLLNIDMWIWLHRIPQPHSDSTQNGLKWLKGCPLIFPDVSEFLMHCGLAAHLVFTSFCLMLIWCDSDFYQVWYWLWIHFPLISLILTYLCLFLSVTILTAWRIIQRLHCYLIICDVTLGTVGACYKSMFYSQCM